ncbi:hypothetical protein MBEHAL_0458 [Halarchaeum acidiphilum MH1-52-1]|uniref:Uncharacterized protein n=1 Tax=Halarchaeum acidiphilum MH1-52-1 TaxID=1261545 RepID=U3AAA4_9EURY|nr:hypothetical protein MBEHAL_0458 [Halarchaeum acidiphilum MH1-52-1]
MHLLVARVREVVAGVLGERVDVLDAVNVLGADEFGRDGRVIPAARPDFEDRLRRVQVEVVGHHGDHVRGADRLVVPDGERAIGVRVVAARLGDERVSRDGSHRVDDALVEVVSSGEPIGQPVAFLLVRHDRVRARDA